MREVLTMPRPAKWGHRGGDFCCGPEDEDGQRLPRCPGCRCPEHLSAAARQPVDPARWAAVIRFGWSPAETEALSRIADVYS